MHAPFVYSGCYCNKTSRFVSVYCNYGSNEKTSYFEQSVVKYSNTRLVSNQLKFQIQPFYKEKMAITTRSMLTILLDSTNIWFQFESLNMINLSSNSNIKI